MEGRGQCPANGQEVRIVETDAPSVPSVPARRPVLNCARRDDEPTSATLEPGVDVKRSEWRSRPDATVDLTPPSMRQPPRIEGLA